MLRPVTMLGSLLWDWWPFIAAIFVAFAVKAAVGMDIDVSSYR